ncbi:hypothetical protein [Cellulomonas dongxiuzhuiae]|uniref:Uncharacterized protein n=1 Tax=Cellulomonas dongxiuzhuiae TaxID=2819979 RepID=A0ABX8GND0_9CELL|nr:hypothetical protein [Cellulomonas dongxiuzhuiae]MBO3095855.1 hypothetical protein [Cellulomonas dongxiuzhuiae]QWC17161.1 hypothetical protein KKR89_06045 [Cellulomonas dongxiuzhuiae]
MHGPTVAGRGVPDPLTLGRDVAQRLAQDGHRLHDEALRPTSLRADDDGMLAAVTVAEFRETVREVAVAVLRAAADAEPARARRPWDAANLLARRAAGHTRYLWAVRTATANALPAPTDAEHETDRHARARRTAARAEAAATAATSNARHRTVRLSPVEVARPLVAKWAATLPTGRHRLPDVWAAWGAAVERTAPGPRRDALDMIGRTTFYALLSDGADVRTGHARSRVLVVPAVPEEPTVTASPTVAAIRVEADATHELADARYAAADATNALTDAEERAFDLLERQRAAWAVGDRLGALRAQSERHTAPGATVLDFEAARARRAAA